MYVVRTGILHVPDFDEDSSEAVVETMRDAGIRHLLMLERSAKSQRNWIADILCRWCDEEELDLILTIGGTLPAPGPGGKEIVPEATSEVIERDLPGLSEAMRAYAREESVLAMLERGRAGIRGRTLIVNLPCGATPAGLFLEAIVDLIGPLIAHLREEVNAPTLQDVLERHDSSTGTIADVDVNSVAADTPAYGLRESDFADYLRRSGKENAGDG